MPSVPAKPLPLVQGPSSRLDSLNKEEVVVISTEDDLARLLDKIQDTEDATRRLDMARTALSSLLLPDLSTPLIVGCIHVLATDVWSQIRRETAKWLQNEMAQLAWPHVEALIQDLLALCKNSEEPSDWKAQEGAFEAMAAILTQFKKQSTSTGGFQVGSRYMPYLPSALLCDLKPAVYQAMQHQQLSVRETATAALIQYVALSDPFTQITTFQEVISKLNLYSPHEVLPAAHAEGLLDVAAQLVCHMPLNFLVKHWQVVFPTCEKYVMHVASTVRQKSAGLICAFAELSSTQKEAIPLLESICDSLALPCVAHRDVSQRDFFWQRMEGRLMAIESVVQVLGSNRLASMSPMLLQKASKPTRSFLTVAQTVDDFKEYKHLYAWEMAPLATWLVENESPKEILQSPPHSILDNVHPTRFAQAWRAFLSHTYECFQSPQYELKRMASQALPGLLRLSLWLPQQDKASARLFPAWLASQNDPIAPTFLCQAIKSLVLHARFLNEVAQFCRLEQLVPLGNAIAAGKTNMEAVIPALLSVDCSPPVEKTLGMAYAEVGFLVLLELQQHPQLLDAVFQVFWALHTQQAAVDRSMSSIVVRYLPGLAALDLDAAHATKLAFIALSWLKADDSLRWIVVESQEARCLLVDTLIRLAIYSRLHCKVDAILDAVKPRLVDPKVPLRLFAKLLYFLSLVCSTSLPDDVQSILRLLLQPRVTAADPTTTAKATLWDEWDAAPSASSSSASADAKFQCLKDFWRQFDAPSTTTNQRQSDLVLTTFTADERQRLQE
ncbi:hypothetical protein AeMF1_012611 [Aphanomyces euteiches]|nr:hypothetical protein AeMF1_012611 [Aphanomyces euteiches]